MWTGRDLNPLSLRAKKHQLTPIYQWRYWESNPVRHLCRPLMYSHAPTNASAVHHGNVMAGRVCVFMWTTSDSNRPVCFFRAAQSPDLLMVHFIRFVPMSGIFGVRITAGSAFASVMVPRICAAHCADCFRRSLSFVASFAQQLTFGKFFVSYFGASTPDRSNTHLLFLSVYVVNLYVLC